MSNLKINESPYGYLIIIDFNRMYLAYDFEIASYLDLTEEEYQDILIKEGALLIDEECFFNIKSDAEKAIKVLEPYLVIANLLK